MKYPGSEAALVDDLAVRANAIARCREILADEAADLSDDDVDQVRRHADAMARLVVQMYLSKAA